jgi:TRAP-type C4-dicarboxylate transport system substrate-binding protein
MKLTRTFVAAAAAGLMTAASATAQDKVVLNYSSWFPPAHSINTALKEWMGNIDKVTEGRVTIEYLPAVVGTVPSQFDVAVDGLADLVLILPGYTPGRFPLLEMGELPLLTPSTQSAVAPAFNRIYDTHFAPLQPFKGTHVMTVFASAPTNLVTNKANPVTSMADFKGLKLRAPSATGSQIIDALGAVTVQKPVTEIYELATTGIVDGTFFSLKPMIDWKTADVFKNITPMPGGMGQSVIAVLMNQAKWDAISEADQKAITEVSGPELAALIGNTWQNDENVGGKMLEEIGGFTYNEISDEFFQNFKDAISPIEQQWIEKAKAAGLEDPAGVLAEYRKTLSANAN